MAYAITPLNRLQTRIETTKGSDIATTKLWVGEGALVEELSFYRDESPRGINATTGGTGIITHKGTKFTLNCDAGLQQLAFILSCAMKGDITPAGAMADKTWAFSRSSLASSNPTLDAATFEFVRSDGSTNHIALAAHYCMPESFGISIARGQVTKVRSSWFGRAAQVEALTGSISAHTNHDASLIASELWKVYLDTTWAGLGGTQLSGVLVSADLDVMTGIKPVTTLDGRSDKDFVDHKVESLKFTLKMTMELNATSAALVVSNRANSAQFIRLTATGPSLGATNYSATFDMACRYLGWSDGADGENVQVTFNMEGYYDETGTQILLPTIVNDITSTAGL